MGASRRKLIPLPASMVQAISLQNHLALVALRSEHGDSLHVTFLLRAAYLAYILRDSCDFNCEIGVFESAEVALCGCSRRAEKDGLWELTDSEIDVLKIVLTLHDEQLQSIPIHRYETACADLLGYLMKSDKRAFFGATDGDNVLKTKFLN